MQSELRQTGVTMMEVLVVVAIASILAVIAAPSFSDFISNSRLSTTMSQLASDLNRARVEAIKRNSWVLVCVSNAAGSDCVAGTDWNNGWLVCYSNNSAATACDLSNTAADPNPISRHQAINARFALTGPATPIRFNPNGTATAAILTLCCKPNSTTSSSASIAVTGNISRL